MKKMKFYSSSLLFSLMGFFVLIQRVSADVGPQDPEPYWEPHKEIKSKESLSDLFQAPYILLAVVLVVVIVISFILLSKARKNDLD